MVSIHLRPPFDGKPVELYPYEPFEDDQIS
jgi:hypothetical protein